MSTQEQFDSKRRKLLEQAIKDDIQNFFILEVEGADLYLVYLGPQSYSVNAVSDVHRETPRVGRYAIGTQEEFTEADCEKIRAWAVRVQSQTVEEADRITREEEAETQARIEEARLNREKKECEQCCDLNFATPSAYLDLSFHEFGEHQSGSRPGPHGNFQAFTCSCGIQYWFNRDLRWWERKTQAQNLHEYRELCDAFKYGVPDY